MTKLIHILLRERIRKSTTGFTLIELLLYTTLAAIMLISVSVFLSILLGSRVKNQTITEVEGQGLYLVQIITQAIRNSENINAPPEGATSPVLSLDVPDVLKNPTVFDENGGVVRISEGANTPIPLTSSRIVISDLVFWNLSRGGTPGTLRIKFLLSHINPEGKNEYDYAKVFYSSATLRQ